ncbi:MAG: hypothetical protein M0008_06910, partial [Actinomycetota bacterium]|nr:hypothetical protein [Actinomycetota bacterium]
RGIVDFSLHGITVHLDRPDPLISHGLSGSSWKRSTSSRLASGATTERSPTSWRADRLDLGQMSQFRGAGPRKFGPTETSYTTRWDSTLEPQSALVPRCLLVVLVPLDDRDFPHRHSRPFPS